MTLCYNAWEMSLAKWSAKKAKQAALEKLDTLPSYKKGRVLHPFPFESRAPIKDAFSPKEINDAIEAAPTESVPLKKLVSGQHSVTPEHVAAYIEDPDAVRPGEKNPETGVPVDKPIVLKYQDTLHLWDGTHRSTAAFLRGEETISSRLVDLDGIK